MRDNVFVDDLNHSLAEEEVLQLLDASGVHLNQFLIKVVQLEADVFEPRPGDDVAVFWSVLAFYHLIVIKL